MENKDREQGKEKLREEYPYLMELDSNGYDSLKKGSRNIKIELQRAYPGIKWSVRSESYSMGCSIDVRWTDGPTPNQVEEISGKYQQGRFNGMEDIYEYSRNIWVDVFGGAKYVQTQREYSKEAYLWAVKEVERTWGVKVKVTESSYGSIYIAREDDIKIQNSNRWASQEVNQALRERDFTKTDEEIETERITKEAEDDRRFEAAFRGSEETRIKAIEEAMEKESQIG